MQCVQEGKLLYQKIQEGSGKKIGNAKILQNLQKTHVA